MGKIRDLHAKLSAETNESITEGLLEIVRGNDFYAIDLNIAQMERGKDSKDQPIVPEYAEATIEYKKIEGQPYDRVTLNDTGQFRKEMVLEAARFPLNITSTDKKTPKLIGKYGKDIFGFTKESLKNFGEQIFGQVKKYFRNLIRVR